ncbi:MAG: TetR/AcrR family transcriptional regulator [Oscillospiraceae bacterium]|nr:TetR/AcrR family transcriptional regulator [Oscillospiraceae bacterium]
MLKKLTEDTRANILEIGISEFAVHGPDRANMAEIARKAGISVGVLYKYYADKDAFFTACLQRSLDALRAVLEGIVAREGRIFSYAEAVIRAVQQYAREHADYMRMYLQITACGNQAHAACLADTIESISASLYTETIRAAQSRGDVRRDMDPRLFAFFFDNLLMMMQFSYCCDYYKARFQRYCGDGILEDNETVVQELLKFLESAFTLEQSEISHRH